MQNKLSPQVLKSDEEKTTVEASMVEKVESLQVGGCSKNTLQGWLLVTGELLTVKDIRKGCEPKYKHISETWILPFAVLFAMVAYAALAFVYYNNDG